MVLPSSDNAIFCPNKLFDWSDVMLAPFDNDVEKLKARLDTLDNTLKLVTVTRELAFTNSVGKMLHGNDRFVVLVPIMIVGLIKCKFFEDDILKSLLLIITLI